MMFWDGGFLANNPLLVALAEVKKFNNCVGIKCVVSLGCGVVTDKPAVTRTDSIATFVSTYYFGI